MNKELLKFKKIFRRTFPAKNEEIIKVLLNIFTIKYSISESDFYRKFSTCVNLTSNNTEYINESPLSDKQLVPLFSGIEGVSRIIYKILLEISDETPTVTYAPLLFPLISILCLYLTECEIKNVIVILLGDIDMIPSSTNDWNVYCHLLLVLGHKYATKSYRYLQSNEDSKCSLNFWPYALWSLPLSFLNRIIVCYFIEGGKVIFRAGLLIWKETFKRHIKLKVDFDWKDEMISTAINIAELYTPQSFLDRMFRIRNFSRARIIQYKCGLNGFLEYGQWISPTTSKGYVAFKTKDSNPSTILSHAELLDIIQNLNPYLSQINKPLPLFSSNKHGYSLRSLYNIAEKYPETLLIIETALNEVIGAFCADSWTIKNRSDVNRFYGKGECFVFKIRPNPKSFYRWNQHRENVLANMFQKATLDSLEVGGGSNGSAIYINSDLSRGMSSCSSTFDNPCLTQYSKTDFLIKSLELLRFEEIH